MNNIYVTHHQSKSLKNLAAKNIRDRNSIRLFSDGLVNVTMIEEKK
jgi:hypothetical protein